MNAIFLTCDDRIADIAMAQAARLARLWGVEVHVFVETAGRGWREEPVPAGVTLHLDRLDGLLPQDLPTTDRWPRAMYARIAAPLLLEGCRRLLYVDPDVLSRQPDPVIWELPLPGGLGAVHDIATLRDPPSRAGTDRARWLGSLGIAGSRYFNSGVLLIDGQAWARRDPLADLAGYLARHGGATQAPDQDFLNWAFPDWTALSPRWNFQAGLFGHGYEVAFPPVLLHYSGTDKPWFGRTEGWRTPIDARCLEAFEAVLREAGVDLERHRRDDRPGRVRRWKYALNAALARSGVTTPRERRMRRRWAAEAEVLHDNLVVLARDGGFADLPAREIGRPDTRRPFDGRYLVRPLDLSVLQEPS